LLGIHILTVVVYNFSWSVYATPEELNEYELESRFIAGPYLVGVLYLLGFTASIYNLCFMTGLRLLGVAFPLKYKLLDTKKVVIGLIIVWIISVAAATAPGNYSVK